MRTVEQILARIEARKEEDFLGFETAHLVVLLPFKQAKPYLPAGAEEVSWTKVTLDVGEVRREMEAYLSFAWEKANNCRGLSAGRSISHYAAWLWLLDDQEKWPDAVIDLMDKYQFYGKAWLARITKYLGFDPAKFDNGAWKNSEDGPTLSLEEIGAEILKVSFKAERLTS